ncbi:MAG: endonuclease/exonuclease/phosphatase family protein, partial [Acidobacteriota bacterium]
MKLSRNHPEVLPGNPRLASPLSLSILSWNVHATPLSLRKGDRLARVVTKILEQRPDVVLLQE